jgi:hypothetical protein
MYGALVTANRAGILNIANNLRITAGAATIRKVIAATIG